MSLAEGRFVIAGRGRWPFAYKPMAHVFAHPTNTVVKTGRKAGFRIFFAYGESGTPTEPSLCVRQGMQVNCLIGVNRPRIESASCIGPGAPRNTLTTRRTPWH